MSELKNKTYLSAHTRAGGYPVLGARQTAGIRLDSRLRGSERCVGVCL